MVLGADKLYAVGKDPQYTQNVQKIAGGYNAYPAKSVGPNYAQYDGKAQPNYAQYDMYKSPVTTGCAGDTFDMMM